MQGQAWAEEGQTMPSKTQRPSRSFQVPGPRVFGCAYVHVVIWLDTGTAMDGHEAHADVHMIK